MKSEDVKVGIIVGTPVDEPVYYLHGIIEQVESTHCVIRPLNYSFLDRIALMVAKEDFGLWTILRW